MAEKAGVHAKTQELKQRCSNSCKQNTSYSFSGYSADRILHLQTTAGNQAVKRLIKSRALQAKFKIGQPYDIYEQEPGTVAGRATSIPSLPSPRSAVLRMQPAGTGGAPTAPATTALIDQFTEAAAIGDVVTMDLLISGGLDVNRKDSSGLTALMRAADAGMMRSVEFLIKRHVDLAVVDRDKKTALFHAAENNQTDVLSRLLQEGADPNIRAEYGRTPLIETAIKGHSIAVGILLDGDANIDDADPINGSTALMWAASNGHADVVSILVSRGADIMKTDLLGQTPLMVAARAGIASSLLGGMSGQRKRRRTEYINARDSRGKTALMYAAEKSDKREVELLLRLGADVNIQDNDKNSAIINVAASPQKDIYVKQAVLSALVRARNANLDLQDNENKTALMRAIEIGDVETVKTLIYYGARIDVESKPGETALTMARNILRSTSMQKEFTFIVRLLESWPKRA